MLKHELNAFLDSLKTEGRLIAIVHVYEQLQARPGLDLYYTRSKLEDMFKEGIVQNPNPYLDLLHIDAFFKDLQEWSANSVFLILDKCLEMNRELDLLKLLKRSSDKISTIKFVDLIKKIMIVEKNSLADKILSVLLDNKSHAKSSILIT